MTPLPATIVSEFLYIALWEKSDAAHAARRKHSPTSTGVQRRRMAVLLRASRVLPPMARRTENRTLSSSPSAKRTGLTTTGVRFVSLARSGATPIGPSPMILSVHGGSRILISVAPGYQRGVQESVARPFRKTERATSRLSRGLASPMPFDAIGANERRAPATGISTTSSRSRRAVRTPSATCALRARAAIRRRTPGCPKTTQDNRRWRSKRTRHGGTEV
jgi:hypothetical protein